MFDLYKIFSMVVVGIFLIVWLFPRSGENPISGIFSIGLIVFIFGLALFSFSNSKNH